MNKEFTMKQILRKGKSLAGALVLLLLPSMVMAGQTGSVPGEIIAKMQQVKKTMEKAQAAKKARVSPAEVRLMKGQQTGSISGTLSGLDDADIPTGWVMAWSGKGDGDSSLGTWGFSTLQPDGSYEISGLNTGKFFVYAQADGYMPVFYPDSEDGRDATPVFVEDGKTTANINFTMKKLFEGAGAIAGTVLDAQTGLPVKEATVTVWGGNAAHHGGYGWATTDENGAYKITRLPEGKYSAMVWAYGYMQQLYGGKDSTAGGPIEVTASQTTFGVDFSLNKASSLSGKVLINGETPAKWSYVVATSGDGGMDSSGIWLPIYGGSAYTDEDGNYTIENLEPADYAVRAETWNRHGYVAEWYKDSPTREEADLVTVATGSQVTGIDFTLDLPVFTGAVSGKITKTDGSPLSFADVALYSVSGGDSVVTADGSTGGKYLYYFERANEAGEFTFTDVPDGSYYVKTDVYTKWNYIQYWYPSVTSQEEAAVIDILGGNQVSGIDITVKSQTFGGVIKGQVTDGSGSPLQGAWITVSTDYRDWWHDRKDGRHGKVQDGGHDGHQDSTDYFPIWASAPVDSFGYYAVDGLPDGDYLVQATYYNNGKYATLWYNQAETYELATPVTLAGSETKDGINFTLSPKGFFGTLKGTVKDADGNVIPNAWVELIPYWEAAGPSDKYMGHWNDAYRTDENGVFLIENLYAGTYTLAVFTNGGYVYYPAGVTPREAEAITITADQTTELGVTVTLKKSGDGAISGSFSVDAETLLPVSGVVIAKPVVTIQSYPESEIIFPGIADNGTYKIPGLANGEYYLYAWTPMAIGEFYDDVYDPSLAKKVVVSNGAETGGIDFLLATHHDWDGPKDSLNYMNGGRFFGKITDAEGNLLPDVTVNLLDAAGEVLSAVKSNGKGYYELGSLPSGTYSLKAGALGMKMKSDVGSVTLNRDQIEVDIVMEAASGPLDVDDDSVLPASVELVSVYPNPFNPETTISFRTPVSGRVTVLVYNMLGQQIYSSVADLNAGLNQIRWNGRSDDGAPASSGVYLFRILSGSQSATGKMILTK